MFTITINICLKAAILSAQQGLWKLSEQEDNQPKFQDLKQIKERQLPT
jgi:hypothetical protein